MFWGLAYKIDLSNESINLDDSDLENIIDMTQKIKTAKEKVSPKYPEVKLLVDVKISSYDHNHYFGSYAVTVFSDNKKQFKSAIKEFIGYVGTPEHLTGTDLVNKANKFPIDSQYEDIEQLIKEHLN